MVLVIASLGLIACTADDPEGETVERFTMNETDSGDTDYTDGKDYTLSLAFDEAGEFSYLFYFNDGTDTAVGHPAEEQTLTVTP